MNPVGIMLLGAFIGIGSVIALYVINTINLKDKLMRTLSNVALTIILASSLIFSVSGCFKVIKERIEYTEFYNSVSLIANVIEER